PAGFAASLIAPTPTQGLEEARDTMDGIADAARVAAPLLGDFGGTLTTIASGLAAGGVMGIGSAIVGAIGGIVDGLFRESVQAMRAAEQWERAVADFAR